MVGVKDQDFAAAIALAFQPGMGDAVRIHEALDRTRLQAEMLGLDGEAIIDRARFRYVQSPRSGTDAFLEMLEGVLAEEIA
jgi:hypothetical protein